MVLILNCEVSAMKWENFSKLESYKKLKEAEKVSLKKVLVGEEGGKRAREYKVDMPSGMVYSYAAKAVDDNLLDILQELADEAELTEKYEALYNGAIINTGEQRLVLHQLTRGQLGKDVFADGVNKREFYKEQQDRANAFANKVHNGEIVNENGEKFTTSHPDFSRKSTLSPYRKQKASSLLTAIRFLFFATSPPNISPNEKQQSVCSAFSAYCRILSICRYFSARRESVSVFSFRCSMSKSVESPR